MWRANPKGGSCTETNRANPESEAALKIPGANPESEAALKSLVLTLRAGLHSNP